MVIKSLIVIFMFVYICCSLRVGDDLHTSVTALKEIFNVEKLLIENLVNYLTDSERNIKFLKKSIHIFAQLCHSNTNKLTDQLYVLGYVTRRTLSKVITTFQYENKSTAAEFIRNFIKIVEENDFPNQVDLDGATLGILRIQEIYETPVSDIANGIINGKDFGKKFTAFDCVMMALKLREMHFHHYAIEWLEIALKHFDKEGWKGILPKKDKTVLIDLLVSAKFEEGSLKNIDDAIQIAFEILKENLDKIVALHFATKLETFIKKYINLNSNLKQYTSSDPPRGTVCKNNLTNYNFLKKGCRGELKKSPAEERKLFCKYEKQNHPFLKLAPIKTEVMNLRPYLTVSYDILYDSEIEILKNLSKGRLFRSGVWNNTKGAGVASTARTSKSVSFSNETHSIMHTLNQRVSDISGLSIETSENFQLMNYGIAGHYGLHADYFLEVPKVDHIKPYGLYEWGNRIATVLFYMSDVSDGGATTWPNINVTVPARKGSAAFWYNLHADGEPDYLAQHSACPVISGSKWVINKWIRVRGQIFRRPCLKYPDHLSM